jgi:hypothetical protein
MGHIIRQIVFPLVSITTSGLLLTITIFAGQDANLHDVQISTFKGTSTAAVACSIIALISVITLSTTQILLIRTWLNHGLFPLTGALVGLVAAILTLDVVVLERINPTYFSESISISNTARIIVWSFASVFQVVFYTLFIFLRQPVDDSVIERRRIPAPLSTLKDNKLAPLRPKTPPTPLRMVAPPFALPQASTPLQLQLPPSTPKRNSWRDSLTQLQQVVRPTASKSRLLSNSQSHTARSSMSRDSQFSETKSITGNSDSFADWWEHSSLSNSSPETAIRELLASSGFSNTTPSRLASGVIITTLEPIPDSRPVSPARTIDLIENMLPESPSVTSLHSTPKPFTPASRSPVERPMTSYSMQSISAAILHTTPSTISRPPTAYSNQSRRVPSSRPTTPSITGGTEAHIHPLFRTDSPTPPPGTSPNTVVVASPFSGTVLPSPRPSFHRQRLSEYGNGVRAPSRSGSRLGNGSTTKLNEDTPSTGGSSSPVEGVSAQTTDEDMTLWEGIQHGDVSGRMTPSSSAAVGAAIPHFVLSASKERII